MASLVSAIVVNYNGGSDLIECIRHLRNQASVSLEIIVVDNASSDGSAARLRAVFPDIVPHVSQTNLGFAAGANEGFRLANGGVLLFLNPDVVLAPGCVHQLAASLRS